MHMIFAINSETMITGFARRFPPQLSPGKEWYKDMGMTMTQKILAAAAGLEKVEAGQLIEADLEIGRAHV